MLHPDVRQPRGATNPTGPEVLDIGLAGSSQAMQHNNQDYNALSTGRGHSMGVDSSLESSTSGLNRMPQETRETVSTGRSLRQPSLVRGQEDDMGVEVIYDRRELNGQTRDTDNGMAVAPAASVNPVLQPQVPAVQQNVGRFQSVQSGERDSDIAENTSVAQNMQSPMVLGGISQISQIPESFPSIFDPISAHIPQKI